MTLKLKKEELDFKTKKKEEYDQLLVLLGRQPEVNLQIFFGLLLVFIIIIISIIIIIININYYYYLCIILIIGQPSTRQAECR